MKSKISLILENKNENKNFYTLNLELPVEEIILLQMYIRGGGGDGVTSFLGIESNVVKGFVLRLIEMALEENGLIPDKWLIVGVDTNIVARQYDENNFTIGSTIGGF